MDPVNGGRQEARSCCKALPSHLRTLGLTLLQPQARPHLMSHRVRTAYQAFILKSTSSQHTSCNPSFFFGMFREATPLAKVPVTPQSQYDGKEQRRAGPLRQLSRHFSSRGLQTRPEP